GLLLGRGGHGRLGHRRAGRAGRRRAGGRGRGRPARGVRLRARPASARGRDDRRDGPGPRAGHGRAGGCAREGPRRRGRRRRCRRPGPGGCSQPRPPRGSAVGARRLDRRRLPGDERRSPVHHRFGGRGGEPRGPVRRAHLPHDGL
ncbi:MAG: hypothetical protein AVDCRST_MAG20-2818, partial [uncultured Acidimicrobiales bacterium]